MPSKLDGEVAAAESFLAELQVRQGRRTVDHALARYLWCGIQTAEVINVACQAGHPAGTAPLRRYLFETVLDIYMLVSSDSPERDTARSLAWDVIDWDRIWELHEEAVAVDPSLDTGNAQAHTAEDAFDALRADLEELGDDLSLFDQAVDAARAPNPHWHWSGKGPSGRMNELATRAEGNQEGLGVVAMLRGIWKILSSSSHPSPAWRRIEIREENDGTLRFPSTSTGGDRSSERVAESTANMLEQCRGLIALYRDMDEPDEE